MTTCQYRAGVYILEEGQAHVICNDTSDEHTPHKHASTSTAVSPPSSVTTQQCHHPAVSPPSSVTIQQCHHMTEQGLGQLRYLGG